MTYTREVRSLNGPLNPASVSASTTRVQRRCTAVFDFSTPAKNGVKPLQIYTAAHCSGRHLDDIVRLDIDVWGGDGYTPLSVSLNFGEDRKRAIAGMSQAGHAQNDWLTAMSWPLALESDPAISPQCRVAVGAPTDKNGLAQDLCLSWADLAVLDASMPEALFEQYKAAIPSTSLASSGPSQLAAFWEGHKNLTRFRYELNAAQHVDALHKCLAPESKCAPQQVAALKDVLLRFVFVDGMNALAAAAKAGVTDSTKSYEAIKKSEYVARVESMKKQWSAISTDDFSVLTNTSSPQISFGAQSLSALGTGLRFNKELYGLRILIPAPQPTLLFSKGDSGSLVVANGRLPILTLQSVDNEETSGGASLQPLPRRTNPSAPVRSSQENIAACK